MDHRTTARQPVELPATIGLNGAVLEGSVRNVSLGGVFVNGVTPADRHARAAAVHGSAARWSTDEGVGLQVDGLRAHDTYALTQFIRSQTPPTARTAVNDIIARAEPP